MKNMRLNATVAYIVVLLIVMALAVVPSSAQQADDLNAILNRAKEYSAAGQYDAALAETQKVEQGVKQRFGTNHPNYAVVLDRLGQIYFALGRNMQAISLYQRAIAILRSRKNTNNGATFGNLAAAYYKLGRYGDAVVLLKRALSNYNEGKPYAQILSLMAAAFQAQGRFSDARAATEKAQSILANATDAGSQTTDIFEQQLASYPQMLWHSFNQLRDNKRERLNFANAGLVEAQRAHQTAAGAALTQMAARFGIGNSSDSLVARLVREQQDLSVAWSALDARILNTLLADADGRNEALDDRQWSHKHDIEEKISHLSDRIESEFPDYAEFAKPKPLDISEIQNLLKRDEAMIVYLIDDEQNYVWAITRDRFDWQPLDIGERALSDQVTRFRRGLDTNEFVRSTESGKPILFDLSFAHDLYTTLLGSVDGLISQKRHLLFVPAGPLTALPFHLLVTSKPATGVSNFKDIAAYRDAAWLVKRQAVSVLPSVASLKALRVFASKAPAPKPMIGFGDPIFDPVERAVAIADRGTTGTRHTVKTRAYSDFWRGANIDRANLSRNLPSLLDSATELKTVARKLGAPANDVLLDKDATETNVKHRPLSEYRVVYFATHGLVAGDVKGLGEPSLALTLPKRPSALDDGLLTASEVAALKLNADWVVLSACNTAAGDKPGAEALSGLARAFFYAGARALLVSHWSVDSASATRLTTTTFDMMDKNPKLNRAEAVRNAMLDYMNDKSSPLNAYPAFWGPFSVIGEGAAK